ERIDPSHTDALNAIAVVKHPNTRSVCSIDSGRPRASRSRYTDEGQPTSAMIARTKSTACIMNATPPYDPAAWLGSAPKRGYRAPSPLARPTSAKLIQAIANAAVSFRNGSTPRNSFAATVRSSVSSSTGTSPDQNFDHRKSRSDTGEVRMIQNAAPSADTAGNTNRTATVDITSPAIPMFTNA